MLAKQQDTGEEAAYERKGNSTNDPKYPDLMAWVDSAVTNHDR